MRPTTTAGDVIALVMACTVASLLILGAVAVIVILVTDPDRDIGPTVHMISDATTALIAAVVGYLAGRHYPPTPPQPPSAT